MRSFAPVRYRTLLAGLALSVTAVAVTAGETVQVSGFAVARASSGTGGVPFYDDPLAAQIQLGLDWRPSPRFGAHVHLLGRDDPQTSHRGSAGIVEAFAEVNLPVRNDRLRILAGAFFLPTSRENVDALWESPYSITSSALNTWFGEEFRPIGIDAAYTLRDSITIGATVYRGNDTFGALPAVRGWTIGDHWALLGEHLRVDERVFTSVSAETDGRLGWSARARWHNERGSIQYTRIDNRSDGRLYGHLYNWTTIFDLIGVDYTAGDWTFAAETGWGPTSLVVKHRVITDPLQATYLLVSRRIGSTLLTARQEWFRNEEKVAPMRATTAALLWLPAGRWRPGVEVTTSEGRTRVLAELRYHFGQ